MGIDQRNKLSLVKSLSELQDFVETASDVSLGDLILNRLNGAANANTDFQQAADKLVRAALDVIRLAEDWAHHEAEARYVNYLREAELLKRDQRTMEVEAEKAVKKPRKRLPESK